MSYDSTNKQTEITTLYIYKLGNLAFHKGVIVGPTDYPHFVVNYDFNYFSR